MALVASGLTYWPPPVGLGGPTSASLSDVQFTLDSTTDALAWIGKSYVSDSIATIYFRTGTIPAGGGDTVDVRIETVSNGRPTGTLWSANGTGAAPNITVAIADSDDNVWKTATLTNAAVLIPGDEFAIVIISSAGTPNILLNASGPGLAGVHGHYPLLLQNATGAYAAPATNGGFQWIVNMTTAGIIYIPGLSPCDGAATLTAFNSGSNPNERALKFQVPFTCRCIGVRAWIANVAAGANFTVSLWDATGDTDAEALAQVTEDGDFALSTTQDGYVEVYFPTAVTLAINTVYYAGVRPDTANSVTVPALTTAGTGQPANSVRAFPGDTAGNQHVATRLWTAGTAGAWTATTTTMPMISLILDQLGDGVSGGGLLTHPGMSGGMRG